MLHHYQGQFRRNILQIFIVAAVYFVLAWLGLLLAIENSNVSPVWPSAGFAFAMILLLGYRITPGILLGAFVANVAVFLSNHTCNLPTALWASLVISLGNTGEAVAGTYMLRKFVPAVKNHDFFLNSGSIFWFLYTAAITCLISCTIGATALLLSGIITQQHYLTIAFTWWTGDVFFFQAEDGIRDHCVTGVQTCALPI